MGAVRPPEIGNALAVPTTKEAIESSSSGFFDEAIPESRFVPLALLERTLERKAVLHRSNIRADALAKDLELRITM